MIYTQKEYGERVKQLRSIAEIIMKKKPEDARIYAEGLKPEDAYILGRIVQQLVAADFHKTGITPY